MLVEIWSDVVCPWCYVGKARFERALSGLGWADEIEVRYRPFELDPRVPRGGAPLDEYLARKFGNVSVVRAAHANLTSAGAELGIEFRWAGMRRANSHDAHRLLTWALASGTPTDQRELKGHLMRAYFTEHRDIADHGVLAGLAGEAGLDADEAASVLASGDFGEEVRAAEAAAADAGVHAVPTYVVENTFAIPGAQDPDAFRHLLERARDRLTPDPSPMLEG